MSASHSTNKEVRESMESVDPIFRKLRAARLAAGLTQDEMAERIGHANHTSFSQLERGLRQPTLNTLRRWTDALGLDLIVAEREDGA